jgi:hypothetical protein
VDRLNLNNKSSKNIWLEIMVFNLGKRILLYYLLVSLLVEKQNIIEKLIGNIIKLITIIINKLVRFIGFTPHQSRQIKIGGSFFLLRSIIIGEDLQCSLSLASADYPITFLAWATRSTPC